jgi:hypothetical protein
VQQLLQGQQWRQQQRLEEQLLELPQLQLGLVLEPFLLVLIRQLDLLEQHHLIIQIKQINLIPKLTKEIQVYLN